MEGDILHQFDVPHPLVRSHLTQLHLSYILGRHPLGDCSLCVWELVANGDPFDPNILQADAIPREKEEVPNKGRLPPAWGQADLVALGVHPERPFNHDPRSATAQGAEQKHYGKHMKQGVFARERRDRSNPTVLRERTTDCSATLATTQRVGLLRSLQSLAMTM